MVPNNYHQRINRFIAPIHPTVCVSGVRHCSIIFLYTMTVGDYMVA